MRTSVSGQGRAMRDGRRWDVIVAGGGPAGCMAALAAAGAGASVLLLERNAKLGRKLYITGKGRCNVTNDCTPDQVLQHIPGNGRFLTSAVTRFPPEEVQAFFTSRGVPLKTERGGRVFPQSDRAADIVDALLRALRRAGVDIRQERVRSVQAGETGVSAVGTELGEHSCKAVILATGGVSYPLTGSTGDGYEMARALGHTVVEPRPSLVPLVTRQDFCARMQGLSLRNVAIKVRGSGKKPVYQGQGELLFTHFGLSGPLILSASAHMRRYDREDYCVLIDLKPALDEHTLDERLLRELGESPNRSVLHVLETLVPRSMAPVLAGLSGLDTAAQANSVTRAQRRALLEQLKGLRLDIAGPRPVEEAIVTAGGIKTGEVNPATMASKRVPGLFFAGELLDVDGYTGGFNLQIAWSTGHAAGLGAAAFAQEGP